MKNLKNRIDIKNIKEFKERLIFEGYNLKNEKEIEDIFKIDKEFLKYIHRELSKEELAFRVYDIENFFDYLKEVKNFEEENERLVRAIYKIKKLIITRVEFERVVLKKDNVENLLEEINKTKKAISEKVEKEEIKYIDEATRELKDKYIFSKDIELLKKIILNNNENVIKNYNEKESLSTLEIEILKEFNNNYIKHKKGSVEYYKFLKDNKERLKRLRCNLDKYIKEIDIGVFKLNQSTTLQDSINIAVAEFNGKKFKAISGKNNIEGYINVIDKPYFESLKINKRGDVGEGYKRVNDSEKKIFEEIHRLIKNGKLDDFGVINLYTLWEPCKSCYFVMSQFRKEHREIKINVKYSKDYGQIIIR